MALDTPLNTDQAAISSDPAQAAPALVSSLQNTTVPAQPAATAAPATLQNQNDVADAAMNLRVNQPQTVKTPLGPALSRALDQQPLQLNPKTGRSNPGSWAASLVGAFNNVMGNLGDISSEKAPAGAGILSGFAKAEANRNQRMAQQNQAAQAKAHQDFEEQQEQQRNDRETQKQQYDLSVANEQERHNQMLWHNTQEIAPMVSQGQKALAVTQNSPKPAPIVARDIDSNALKQMVIDGKINSHDFTYFPSSVKTDDNGNTRALYTVVGNGGPVVLDPEKDADTITFLNDNHATEQPILPGQKFDNLAQFNSVYQNAANTAAATAARNKTLIANDMDAKNLEAVQIGPDWNNALANATDRTTGVPDPLKALANMQARPDLVKKYPNLFQDVREAYGKDKSGDYNIDKLIELRQKNVSSDDLKIFNNDLTAYPYLDPESKKAFSDDAARATTKADLEKISDRAERQNAQLLQKKMSENNAQATKSNTHDDAVAKQVSDALDELGWKGKGNYKTSAELNNEFAETLSAAKTGDETAAAFARTQGIQGVNNVAQLSRIPPTEYAAQDEAGSIKRQIANRLAKAGSGTMAPDTLKELQGLQQRLQATQYVGYIGSVRNAVHNRGGNTDGILVLAPNGSDEIQLNDAIKTYAPQAAPATQATPKPAAQAAKPAVPVPGVPHNVIVNGKIVGTTTDGGKTMTPVAQ